MTFVADRPGHDQRYAVDTRNIRKELGWSPATPFEAGLSRTVRWYLDHHAWWQGLRSSRYAGDRLGLRTA